MGLYREIRWVMLCPQLYRDLTKCNIQTVKIASLLTSMINIPTTVHLKAIKTNRTMFSPYKYKRLYRLNSTLQQKSHLCFPRKGIVHPQSQLPHSRVCEQFLCSQDRSTYFPTEDRSWEYTDTWKSKLVLRPRNSFSGNICFEFSVLCLCSVQTETNILKYRSKFTIDFCENVNFLFHSVS
jgi:hypothetical protein